MANKQKKRTNMPLWIIVLIAVAIVVAIVLIKNNLDKNKSTKTSAKVPATATSEQVNHGNTFIDYNNTENAKVENGVKTNTSSEVAEEKNYQGLKIKNVRIYSENENSKFTAEFENTSNKDFEGKEVNIVFLNSEGQEYYRLPSVYIPKVRQGETVPFVTGTSSDIINAYNYTIQ